MKAKILFYLLAIIFLTEGMAEAGDYKISFLKRNMLMATKFM